MPSEITWVVAANGSQAKLFRMVKFPKLEEIEVFEHPESRLRNQDLVSAKPGRTFESTSMARSAYESATSPHQEELKKFAKYLGEHLSSELDKKSFSRLYIMANPSFLGLLRQHLNDKTEGVIIAEIGKDMTGQPISYIEDHLKAMV